MNFNFGEVLSRAGQITWKHKNLWLAGIVIGLLGVFPSLISLTLGPSFSSLANINPYEVNRQMPAILLVNGLTIFMSLLLIPIYVIGMAVPALGTLRLETGSETLNVGELARGTLPYFWRILGVLLLVWLGTFLFMFGFIVCDIAVSVITLGFGSICLVPILIPLVILVFAMMEQGMAAVLVDNAGVSEALRRAWELIKKNPGVVTLMSLMIYLGSMMIGMVVSLPILIPMFGFMTNMLSAEPNIQAFEKLFHTMTWWMLAISPLYAVVQGVLLTFTQSAWTLTYMRLTSSQGSAPVLLEAHA